MTGHRVHNPRDEARRQLFRQLRTSVGLTQRQVAERLGVHEVTVGQWEIGRRKVSTVTLAAMQLLVKTSDLSDE